MAAKPRFDGEWVRLGEIISKAKSKRCGSGVFPVLSMTMHGGIVEQSDRFKKKVASRDTSSYKVVEPGQLVVGFPIDEGVIYVQNYPYPGIMSPAYSVWDINGELIDAAYLELVLHGPRSMAYYANKMRGTTARRRSLTADNLSAMRIPLPCLERQRRVVHLFNTVKNEMVIANKVVEALDQLVKSRFVEIFGDPSLKVDDDNRVEIGAFADVQTGATPSRKRSDYYGGSIPWVKTGEVARDFENGIEESITDLAISQTNCKLFSAGSVLIAMYGQGNTRGKSSILPFDAATNQACAAVLPSDRHDPVFLNVQLGLLYEELRDKSLGGNQKNLSLGIVKATKVLLPPLALQQEFAAFVAEVDKSRFIVQQQIEKLQMLYDSLAQEYFS